MPANISIDPRKRIGMMRLSGQVDGAELIEAIRQLFASPAAGLNVVWDTRHVCDLHLSREEMQNVADVLDGIHARCRAMRWAVIGKSHEAVALTTILLSTAGTPRQLRLFNDAPSARTWLTGEQPGHRSRAATFQWSRLRRN